MTSKACDTFLGPLKYGVFFLWMILFALPALAQDTTSKGFDFSAWQSTATRAEEIISNATASTPALETLRADLTVFRKAALSAMDSSQARVGTLRAQIVALGPTPAEGETEAAEIAARRAELAGQMAAASGPALAAQEAYHRADGIIREIDKIIRERLASQFFSLGPSPLNPTYWPAAWSAIFVFTDAIRREVADGLASKTRMVEVRQNLPLTLTLLLVGFLLMTRARKWLLKAIGLVPASTVDAMHESRRLLSSVSQVAVPLLGVWTITAGLDLSGLDGYRGSILISILPYVGLAFYGAVWLGRTLFSKAENTSRFFDLTPAEMRVGRIVTILMGVVLAASTLLLSVARLNSFPDEATVVLSFPILVAAGLTLIRMGMLLHPKPATEDMIGRRDGALKQRMIAFLCKVIIALGAIGPVLATIGYFTAASAFAFPPIKTLAVLGVVMLAYSLLTNFAEGLAAAGSIENGKGSRRLKGKVASQPTLVPVIIGFLLICVSLPIFALIWGARLADLLEVWSKISDGFAIGDRRISVVDFLYFAAVFVAGYTVTRLLQSTLRSTVLPRTKMDSGGRNAVLTGTGYIGIFLSAMAAITSAGLDLSSVALVAGALSVGIGFGLQAVVSNFVSGIILLVERPIKEGDWIEVGAYSGYVQKISVRATEIETFDRATVVIPNADFITGSVVNWTHGNMNGRVKVPIGVAYGSDARRVAEILHEIATSHPMLDKRTEPNVVFVGFGADSMDFEIRLIIKDVNWMLSVSSDINFEIVERFAAEGIEIPFAQRDINIRNIDQIAAAFGVPKPKGKS